MIHIMNNIKHNKPTPSLQAMLKFWTTMHQDKKYIKTSTIGDMEGGLVGLPDMDAISTANGPSVGGGGGGMTAAPSTIISSSGAIIGGAAGSSALDTRSISSEFHNRQE